MKRNIVSIGIVIMMLFLFNITQARVWYVHPDSTLNRIQNALNGCSAGDTVLVGPGTYFENIVWPSTQGIDLISESGSAVTIIDGSNPSNPDSGSVVLIATEQETTTVISGFTITNGTGTIYGNMTYGGGIYCDNYASPSIINNLVTGNNATWGGGGIGCYNSSPIISNNIIRNNAADSAAGGVLTWMAHPTISDNVISHNTSDYGGGLHIVYLSNPTLIHNDILNNTVRFSGGGLGIVSSSAPTLQFNNIIGNRAYRCGGIYVGWAASPIILNCVIENDTADSYLGGGIRIYRGSSATLRHTTIANNYGSGVCCENSTANLDSCTISNNSYHGIDCFTNGNPTVHWCDITNNTYNAVNNSDPAVVINAENNWWGDSTGPYHYSTNPGGLGDTVSDYVDFEPWLLEPVGLFEQSRLVVKHPMVQTTIVRGILNLQSAISNLKSEITLLDISGRKVADLKSGANDIRHLAPGVYFVRQNGNNQTTKVVIQK